MVGNSLFDEEISVLGDVALRRLFSEAEFELMVFI
jgi:hypothetical protein